MMIQYNVMIQNEYQKDEIDKILYDYEIKPKVANCVYGDLIYQIDMQRKQTLISPAFIVLEDSSKNVISLDRFKNIRTEQQLDFDNQKCVLQEEEFDKEM